MGKKTGPTEPAMPCLPQAWEKKTRGTLRVICNTSPLYNENLLSLEQTSPWRCSSSPRSGPLQEVSDRARDVPT